MHDDVYGVYCQRDWRIWATVDDTATAAVTEQAQIEREKYGKIDFFFFCIKCVYFVCLPCSTRVRAAAAEKKNNQNEYRETTREKKKSYFLTQTAHRHRSESKKNEKYDRNTEFRLFCLSIFVTKSIWFEIHLRRANSSVATSHLADGIFFAFALLFIILQKYLQLDSNSYEMTCHLASSEWNVGYCYCQMKWDEIRKCRLKRHVKSGIMWTARSTWSITFLDHIWFHNEIRMSSVGMRNIAFGLVGFDNGPE